MTRITPVTPADATGETKDLYDHIASAYGKVPNMLQVLGRSPAALKSYLGFSDAVGTAGLPASLREQIALAVAGANSCDYCAAAHTAIGKSVGIDAAEASSNLEGDASDPKAAAALRFARTIVDARGRVPDVDLAAVKAAGYDDTAVLEIVAATVLNIFTNYVNHIADPEIDFPRVKVPVAVA